MGFWVYAPERFFLVDGVPSLEAAQVRLAGRVGRNNILAVRGGMTPTAASGLRSGPAFLFLLNDAGKQAYARGIAPPPSEFSVYPDPPREWDAQAAPAQAGNG